MTDIQWELDGGSMPSRLDKKIIVNFPISILKVEDKDDYAQVIDDYINDEISNISGFCHSGFCIDYDSKELLDIVID